MCRLPAAAWVALPCRGVGCSLTTLSGNPREKVSSALFFKHNTQLGPPYQVLVDTNFINFSIKNKVWWQPLFCCEEGSNS